MRISRTRFDLFMAFCAAGLLFSVVFTSCEDDTMPQVIERGTVTDHHGRVYGTVKIGDQWWMAEDLRVSSFSNGDPIRYVDAYDSASWVQTLVPSYSIYEDLQTVPGFLYNAAVIDDSRGIAPEGWHVATDDDWKQLERHIGLASSDFEKTGWRGSSQGDDLKTKGLDNWTRYDNVWATDSYGFAAKAGGCRLFDARFSYPSGLKYSGFWWTSTKDTDGEHFYRHLDYKKSSVFRSHIYDGYGMSIRCVKD